MRLYLIHSVPQNGLLPVLEARADHVLYQHALESRGILFGAGPLADEAEESWDGEGLFIYRAAGLDAAVSTAAADPMHLSGARTFRVRPWLLNEGSLSLRVVYSSGRSDIS
ncbi:hypothetical protein GCM10009836_34650 [Pseudonocardia ailaonensis]|uniref:YCII-related domain-containing protein n=2 Tax=Pseudonocardia ailaonensis TaxID=367279 RepID=A0ABN2N566_9PSEU